MDFVVFLFKLRMRKQIVLYMEGQLSLSSSVSTEQEAEDPELVKARFLCSRSPVPEGCPSRKQLHYSLVWEMHLAGNVYRSKIA